MDKDSLQIVLLPQCLFFCWFSVRQSAKLLLYLRLGQLNLDRLIEQFVVDVEQQRKSFFISRIRGRARWCGWLGHRHLRCLLAREIWSVWNSR